MSKTCKNKECKNKFTPERDFQTTCDYLCAIKYAQQLKEKREATKKKNARIALREYNNNDVKKLTVTAKKEVQKYVRLRDINEPCISCRKPTAKQWDGGHYMNAEHYAKIRFNTLNIHKQCSWCNDFSSSNAINYRIHLINKIGAERVGWLEQQKGIARYSAEYLNNLIRVFRKKNRQLTKKISNKQ